MNNYQLSKNDIINGKVPAGKILVEVINLDNIKRGGIYIPSNTVNLRDGIIRKIGDQLDNTYYNLNLEKRVPINVKVGDYVYLNFISDFYRLVVDNTTYVVINPTTIVGVYNKDYYKHDILNAKI